VLLAGVVVIDQLTKFLALSQLTPGEPVEVLGRFLMFTLVFNQGGALGTSFGPTSYYLIASICILGFVLYYAWLHRRTPAMLYPLTLIAGGAIGNIIDRIRIGRVIDFLDMEFFDVNIGSFHMDRWWTFNMADVAISLSIAFLIVYLLFLSPPTPDKGEPARDGGGM